MDLPVDTVCMVVVLKVDLLMQTMVLEDMEELKQETLGSLLVRINLMQRPLLQMLMPVLALVVMEFIIPTDMEEPVEAAGMVDQAHTQMALVMMTVVVAVVQDMFIHQKLQRIIQVAILLIHLIILPTLKLLPGIRHFYLHQETQRQVGVAITSNDSGSGVGGIGSTMSGMVQAGIGIGAAVSVGKATVGMMNGMMGDMNPASAYQGWTCPSCGATGNDGKFCKECGAKKPEPVQTWTCPSCGAIGNDGKFCKNCGAKRG